MLRSDSQGGADEVRTVTPNDSSPSTGARKGRNHRDCLAGISPIPGIIRIRNGPDELKIFTASTPSKANGALDRKNRRSGAETGPRKDWRSARSRPARSVNRLRGQQTVLATGKPVASAGALQRFGPGRWCGRSRKIECDSQITPRFGSQRTNCRNSTRTALGQSGSSPNANAIEVERPASAQHTLARNGPSK